jgi:hypothetical protein
MARKFPRKAAIEASITPYFTLTCGHYTSREVAILYSVFAPHIKDVYCEHCGEFYEIVVKKRAEYPDNPLFLKDNSTWLNQLPNGELHNVDWQKRSIVELMFLAR